MDPVIALVSLGGYASRASLLRRGVTQHALVDAHRTGRLVRIQHGIYGVGLPEGTESLRAAVAVSGGVVSHDSAALLWGLEMVHQPALVVTVARNCSRRTVSGCRIVRADLLETEVRGGLRVTTALRTVIDCARTLPLAEAVVIADSALRKGLVTVDELQSEAEKRHRRNAAEVRRVVQSVDPKSASVLESLLRVLLTENGLAPDKTQFPVFDEEGNLVAWVDFAYLLARLLVEADGFEFHRERADYRKDRRRANAFCRLGWRLLRFSWEDVRFDPAYVVAAVAFELNKSGSEPPRRTAG